MIDPRTVVGLDPIVHTLETLADEFRTLAQGDDWQDPQVRLFSAPARETKSILVKLKTTAFEMAWIHFKEIHGLSNADDDSRAKEELGREFKVSAGLQYGSLEKYFQNLGGASRHTSTAGHPERGQKSGASFVPQPLAWRGERQACGPGSEWRREAQVVPRQLLPRHIEHVFAVRVDGLG